MQVRNSEVLIYNEWTGPRMPPKRDVRDLFKTAYSGKVTNQAQKRLKKAISLLVQKSPKRRIYNPVVDKFHDFRISFVTLTIADQGQDDEKTVYQKCLAPWLRWARRAGAVDYVWKAEPQKRGEVHYHLATNVFLHFQEIQDTWNKYQRKAGYLNNYALTQGHFKANSTDVHAVRKVKDIERYLSKYFTKVGGQPLKGKVWDCSTNLKRSNYFATEMTPHNLDLLRAHSTKEIKTDHCVIFRIKPDSAPAFLDAVQMHEYRYFLSNL